MRKIDKDFWRNELDIAPFEMNGDGSVALNGKINDRIMSFLGERFGIPGDLSLAEKKERLNKDESALSEIMSVFKFAKRKINIAISGIAESVLSDEDLARCRDRAGEYDRNALLFAVYVKNPKYLKYIHLIEKIHRSGFAQMVLPPSKDESAPETDWGSFMTRESIQVILDEYEKRRGESKLSQCRDVLPFNGRHVVFIKRDDREDFVTQNGINVFGYRPEWIILDFEKDAERVRISSLTTDVSLEIANGIASGFRGGTCLYENEKDLTDVEVIREFLDRACFTEPERLPLIEIVVRNSPLNGSPKLKISSHDCEPIGEAVRQFNDTIGDVLKNTDVIDSIKVHFKHRVTLLFDQCEDDPDLFVVRYSDSRLNAVERMEFERFMEEEFDIRVLSTEKR